MTVIVMMILMMKMADNILSESVRIFIYDCLCIYEEMSNVKLCNEGICDLYRESNIVGAVK
jgi:hypothetical protein